MRRLLKRWVLAVVSVIVLIFVAAWALLKYDDEQEALVRDPWGSMRG